MIKFFRHIRKRLIGENRFSKYLLYAIGEIILVVIGILIALQINNWNEMRKNNEMEANYISRLLDDLTEEENYLQSYINYNTQVSNCAKKAIQYFESYNNTSHNPEEGLIDLYQASQINDARAPNSTYLELIASGQINLLRSDSLKQSIISYYELKWNESVIINLPNRYRENLRSTMPHVIQDMIRTNCGDIYIGTRRSISVTLPENCTIGLAPKKAESVFNNLLNDSQLKKDLVFLIGNLDSKLAYVNYVLLQLNSVKGQLENMTK